MPNNQTIKTSIKALKLLLEETYTNGTSLEPDDFSVYWVKLELALKNNPDLDKFYFGDH